MKIIRIWRRILLTLIAFLCIFIVPFLQLTPPVSDTEGNIIVTSLPLKMSFDNVTPASWALIAFSIVYIFLGLMATTFKFAPSKIFSVSSISMSFVMLIILGILPFETIYIHGLGVDAQETERLAICIPVISLIIMDITLAIVSISLKMNNVVVSKPSIPDEPEVEPIEEEPEFNYEPEVAVEQPKDVEDSMDLKRRIQEMQEGLAQSYEESIDEIEHTGAWGGMDMTGIFDDIEHAAEEGKHKTTKHKTTHKTPKEKNLEEVKTELKEVEKPAEEVKAKEAEPAKEEHVVEEKEEHKTTKSHHSRSAASNDDLKPSPTLEDPLASIADDEDYEDIKKTKLKSTSNSKYEYLSRRHAENDDTTPH